MCGILIVVSMNRLINGNDYTYFRMNAVKLLTKLSYFGINVA